MSDHDIRGALFHTTRRGTAPLAKDHRGGAWFQATQEGAVVPAAERVCQRAGCRQAATVTLSFRYDARQASLVDLSEDKDPAFYDLCAAHADVLIVPRGWERLDRRTPSPERDPQVTPDQPSSESSPDRYAALTAALPRLAEAWCAGAAAKEPPGSERSSPTVDNPAPTAAAGPSTEDARAVERRTAHPYEPVTRTLLDDEAFELEGQLQMPIEPKSRGVVVALTRSRPT